MTRHYEGCIMPVMYGCWVVPVARKQDRRADPVGWLGGPFFYVSHAETDQNEEDVNKNRHSGDTESNHRNE